ncbi:DUF4355 domain-containing protein [Dethiothermospora halolimnae]|uniref:DUF4355 domain-containing protein n=1 Tax=Dethiothermospora halolimnae TaxID=3114390 RepID=UPI003CCB803F
MKNLNTATLRTKDLKGHKMNIQLFAEGGEGQEGDEQDEKNKITLDSVKKFLEESEDGQKWLQSHTDSKVTKGIETFKEKSLPSLLDEQVNAKIKELYPEETEEQKKLRQLEDELTNIKKEKTKESLKNKAISLANEKGLPIKLVDFFVGADEESTLKNLQSLEEVYNAAVQKAVEEKFKNNGREPAPSKAKTDEEAKKELETLAEKARNTGRVEDRMAYAKAKREYEQNKNK